MNFRGCIVDWSVTLELCDSQNLTFAGTFSGIVPAFAVLRTNIQCPWSDLSSVLRLLLFTQLQNTSAGCDLACRV